MVTFILGIRDSQSHLIAIRNRRISACIGLFLGLLCFLSSNFILLGADGDAAPQGNQDEIVCQNLFNELNYIYDRLLAHNQTNSESFQKIKMAMEKSRKLTTEKRYQEAIQLYTETLNWYKQLKKMESRLDKWQKIIGKLTDQLSEKTKREWFALKDKLSKGETKEWLVLCEQLSNKTKRKWLKELEDAQTDSRRIWIIWLLSLDSLIDYPDVAPCLDGTAIDKDDDATSIFFDMFSGSRHEYGVFMESFEQYMGTWQELLSAHCLDRDVEQDILDIIERQKDYFGNNLVTTRLRSKLRLEIKKWIDMQIDNYDDFMQKIQSGNLTVLDNDRVTVGDLQIIGLSIEKEYYKKFKRIHMNPEHVPELIGMPDSDKYSILIAHNPQYGEAYFEYPADLFVSGHFHGCLIRLPFIGGIISPAFRLFPKYNGGLYQKNGRYGYVSCGIGSHTLPIRFYNPGEVTEITIEGTGEN